MGIVKKQDFPSFVSINWQTRIEDSKSGVPLGTVGSNPVLSAKSDTAVDTIVSTAVSLFYLRKHCDCKVFSVIELQLSS